MCKKYVRLVKKYYACTTEINIPISIIKFRDRNARRRLRDF